MYKKFLFLAAFASLICWSAGSNPLFAQHGGHGGGHGGHGGGHHGGHGGGHGGHGGGHYGGHGYGGHGYGHHGGHGYGHYGGHGYGHHGGHSYGHYGGHDHGHYSGHDYGHHDYGHYSGHGYVLYGGHGYVQFPYGYPSRGNSPAHCLSPLDRRKVDGHEHKHGEHRHGDHEHGDHEHAGPAVAGKTPIPVTMKGIALLAPADQAAALAQTTCPVTGDLLGSDGKPIKVQVGRRTVFVCCKGCVNELKSKS